MNIKMKLETKIVFVEVLFVVGALIYLAFSIAPKQLSPLNGDVIIEPDFIFEIENGNEVLLSVYEDFEEYVVLNENSEVTLSPGTYYWKVRNNFMDSDVRKFTIQSHVDLKILEGNESNKLINSGNVDVEVQKKNDSDNVGFILGINEMKNIENDNSTYEGRQNE